MSLKAINHITFSVSDLDRAIEFYQTVFGAELVARGERLAYFNLCGIWLALNIEKDIPRNEIHRSYTHIAFSIEEEDYEQELGRLEGLGIELVEGRARQAEEGRSIYFKDPDGHRFELHTGTLAARLEYYRKARTDIALRNDGTAIHI